MKDRMFALLMIMAPVFIACSSFYKLVETNYCSLANSILIISGESSPLGELASLKIAAALEKTRAFDVKYLDSIKRENENIPSAIVGPYKSGYISVQVDYTLTDRNAVELIGSKIGSEYILVLWVASKEFHQSILNKVRLLFQVYGTNGKRLLGNGEYDVVFMDNNHVTLGLAPRSFEDAMDGVAKDIAQSIATKHGNLK